MITVTPPIIFSKEVAQKQASLLPRQDLPQLPEIVSDQISGEGARMNFRFSLALPPAPTLAAGAAALRPPWQPLFVDHGALPAAAPQLCKKGAQAKQSVTRR